MRWQDFTIEQLLVHRPPMLLLDEVVDYAEDVLVARLTVPASGRPGSADVPALLCFEYMTQAMAAHRGVADRLAGAVPREALVLGTREMVLEVEGLVAGARLLVRVEAEVMLGQELCRYRCTVVDETTGFLVATADMKVFQAADMDAFFRSTTP